MLYKSSLPIEGFETKAQKPIKMGSFGNEARFRNKPNLCPGVGDYDLTKYKKYDLVAQTVFQHEGRSSSNPKMLQLRHSVPRLETNPDTQNTARSRSKKRSLSSHRNSGLKIRSSFTFTGANNVMNCNSRL